MLGDYLSLHRRHSDQNVRGCVKTGFTSHQPQQQGYRASTKHTPTWNMFMTTPPKKESFVRAIRYCVSALDTNIGDTHTHVPGTFRTLGRGCLAGLHPEHLGPSKRPCLRFRTFQWRSQSLPMEGPLMLRVEFKGKTQKLPGGERSNLLFDLRCPSQTKARKKCSEGLAFGGGIFFPQLKATDIHRPRSLGRQGMPNLGELEAHIEEKR